MKTFREIYCERHGLAKDRFDRSLQWRCLHWQVRPFYWLLGLNRDFCAADVDFIRGVGSLRSRRDFGVEVAEFHAHPRNRVSCAQS